MVASYREHGNDVRFVGVIAGPDSLIDDQKVRLQAMTQNYTFPQVRDRGLDWTKYFGIEQTPTLVLLGPGGSVQKLDHVPEL